MKKPPFLPNIPEQDQTPLVKTLLGIIEQMATCIQQQDEEIALLKDEINILKGEKKRPVFKGSKLDKKTDDKQAPTSSSKRAGSVKKKKTLKLVIHEDKVIKPDEPIPVDSRFKGYRDFVVQDLDIRVHTTRYRLEHWVTPENQSLTGKLPASVNHQHFGAQLIRYVLYQYHHCQTTQPLLREQLREWGIDISSGQINRLLLEDKALFHAEKDSILQAGLTASSYVTVDDSGARHQGKNGYVTHIGNEFFGWFQSTDSKSRVNFLELLRAGQTDYHLNASALAYMQQQSLPHQPFGVLQLHQGRCFGNKEDWFDWLDSVLITKERHRRIATEAALLGSILHHGRCDDLVILSDDAGQFNILIHALCWVHTERLIHKLIPLNETHRQDITRVRGKIWDLYKDLKRYKVHPTKAWAQCLRVRFDAIFSQETSYITLNLALKRIYNNKPELLMVLDRPEIPLHSNGSETDIRDYVKKKKVSGGTRSDEGRRCRDTFATLKKTCRKLDISFWDYLSDRLSIGSQPVALLSDVIYEKALATGY